MGGQDADARARLPESSTSLPFDDSAPRLGRQFIARATGALPGGLRADGLLLASELVTNAVRYGRPEINLRVSVDPTRLRVEVSDEGEQMPAWLAPGVASGQPRGRGLVIVNHLATAWGVAEARRGKTVWFELRVTG